MTYEGGLEIRREVLGAQYVDEALARATPFTRPMQELTTEYCWGAVWTRPGLDRRTRSLINLGMLTALNRSHELGAHVRGALKKRAVPQPEFSPIGFVGLGHIGLPMASVLADAGYAVRGYDVDPAAREAFPASVGSLAEAAEDVRAVLLSLPSSTVVRSVLLEEGLLAAVAPGTLIVDMGSSEPAQTRELAETAAAKGAQLIDAPVSGGVRAARAGTLTIMVGGPAEAVAACRPLLEAVGGKVLHVGLVGAGHALKALNNLLSATTLLATCEAWLVGERFGLDPQLMLDAVNSSTGRSYSTEHKLPDFVLPRSYTAGFGLQLMVKDLRTALGLARATDAPFHLGETTVGLWEQAAAALPEDADHTEIARWLEALAEGKRG